MKKIVEIIVVVIILVGIGVAASFYFETPFNRINRAVGSKTGFTELSGPEQITQTLIPLAYDLVIKRYPQFASKSKPAWSVLNDEEYKKVEAQKIKDIAQGIRNDIASAKGTLAEIDDLIVKNDNLLASQAADYENNCVKATVYSDCPNFLTIYEKNKVEIPKIKAQAQEAKGRWRAYIAKSQANLDSFLNNPIDVEAQGAVTYADGIYMKYLDTKKSPTEYLAHAIHELFHFLTYSKTNGLPRMWEESLTDYFTITTLSAYVGEDADSYSGYPYEVRFMRLLSGQFSEKQLLEAYTTKDISKIKATIDAKYGQGIFDELSLRMNTLFYRFPHISDSSKQEAEAIFKEVEAILSGNAVQKAM